MTERYSFPDFIKFCTSSGGKIRVEEQVFWYNKIPLPAVLVKKIFFDSENFLTNYANHLLSGVVLALNQLGNHNSEIDFDFFPDENKLSQVEVRDSLAKAWQYCQTLDSYKSFEQNLSSLCGMDPIELQFENFLQCLGHQGKKYERLYYPVSVKQAINSNFSRVTTLLKSANGDFFGNVIADELTIYRSGFGDAFSGVFNRYLDFKFDRFPSVDPREGTAGQTEMISVRAAGVVKPVDYAGGYLWDPFLQQGGGIGIQLNKNHPILDLPADQQFGLLLLALAKEEMSLFDPALKDSLEEYRFRVSRTLMEYSSNESIT
jgi:hypothetical protein